MKKTIVLCDNCDKEIIDDENHITIYADYGTDNINGDVSIFICMYGKCVDCSQKQFDFCTIKCLADFIENEAKKL